MRESDAILVRGVGVPSDTVTAVARRFGLSAGNGHDRDMPRAGDDIPVSTEPADQSLVVLIEAPGDAELLDALQPPTVACVEVQDGDVGSVKLGDQELQGLIDGSVLVISLTATTAYSTDAARIFCRALAQRHPLPMERWVAIELVIHEALANAVIHGSLGIEGFARQSVDDFETYCRHVQERLADERYCNRRVTMAAHSEPDALVVTIQDQGEGFSVETIDGKRGEMPMHRGLDIICNLADAVDIQDGGRRVSIRFYC